MAAKKVTEEGKTLANCTEMGIDLFIDLCNQVKNKNYGAGERVPLLNAMTELYKALK